MKKILTLLTMALIIGATSGCAKKVMKSWAAAGGSRADATVQVGFVYNPQTEIPEVTEYQGRRVAEEKCRFWGYPEAEPFGMVKKQCQQIVYNAFAGPQCVEILVTQEYQCLGRGDMATTLEQPPASVRKIKP